MRKTLVVLSLLAATWFVSAGDAFAQVRFGRGGVTIGGGNGYYGGGGYGGGYYGNSYNRGYYPGNYGGYNSRYNSPYYGSNYYSTPSYYSSPSYYVDPAPSTIVQQSYYSAPAYSAPSSQNAMMTILVPDPNAELWFNDVATSQRGTTRTFQTPTIDQPGTYVLRARWNQNGQFVDQTRRVDVQPGQSLTVDFRQ